MVCRNCSAVFPDKGCLFSHLRERDSDGAKVCASKMHSKPPPKDTAASRSTCNNCGTTFADRSQLFTHLGETDPDGTRTCKPKYRILARPKDTSEGKHHDKETHKDRGHSKAGAGTKFKPKTKMGHKPKAGDQNREQEKANGGDEGVARGKDTHPKWSTKSGSVPEFREGHAASGRAEPTAAAPPPFTQAPGSSPPLFAFTGSGTSEAVTRGAATFGSGFSASPKTGLNTGVGSAPWDKSWSPGFSSWNKSLPRTGHDYAAVASAPTLASAPQPPPPPPTLSPSPPLFAAFLRQPPLLPLVVPLEDLELGQGTFRCYCNFVWYIMPCERNTRTLCQSCRGFMVQSIAFQPVPTAEIRRHCGMWL